MTANTTRQNIVEAASDLFYRQGFEHTSFSHIADVVKISRGNFYHHFKTKDDILQAVIAFRVERTRAMLDEWQAEGTTPLERIRCFIRILITNQNDIVLHGCPVGTLSTELAKLNHGALDQSSRLFVLFRDWLSQQFEAIGCGDQAGELAMHVLARSQGVATVANAFHDKQFIVQEVEQMYAWLASIDEKMGEK